MTPTTPFLIRPGSTADDTPTRRAVERLAAAGEYEKIAPGAYVPTGSVDDTVAAWLALATRRPDVTICLMSAAALHDLTDEIPRTSHLALPRPARALKTEFAPITWHFFAKSTFDIGRDPYPLPGGQSIGLYSAERTIIDLFRLRHTHGEDLAVAALKTWLGRRTSRPGSLLAMAGSFPTARPEIRRVLEVLL
ncbi:hypothetical protein ACH47X_14265 [Promicromonospora kroppenstedtii]|uniref:Transcriptional regulator, AbiEi antitoxin, Type IV TA system n=1 Tax=Promicromonospora kroppenstedtii TaxID=440482 RepID=A0ABW7XL79_9MICO